MSVPTRSRFARERAEPAASGPAPRGGLPALVGGVETSLYVPPGWPESVRPPGAPDWEQTAVAFLLDCCPSDYRLYPVLRRHPIVLARFAAECVEAQARSCAAGLSEVRASLGELMAPDVVEAAAQAWHEQESVLTRRQREVELVEEVLRGRVFIRKL